MLNLAKLTILVVMTLSSFSFVARADNSISQQSQWYRNGSLENSQGDDHFKLRVALWGDAFYNDDPNIESRTIESMNAHHLDFTIFAGDTKNGSSLCTDDAIGQEVVDIFNWLNAPTLYTLGDNEWTDCHRINNGEYDPLERLDYLRTTFFNKDTTQGYDPIPVERQGELGKEYSENSRFVMNNVEFVALNVPGSNNNLVATEKQCTKKSNRTWPGAACDAATAEYEARNAQDIAWLQDSFQRARDNDYAGILIVIQADVFFPFELSDGGFEADFLPTLDDPNNGYADFCKTLIEETHNFNGQVVLVHGDSHYFKIDKAMVDPEAEGGHIVGNFTRVEVFGSADNNWIEMTVDPSSENVFSFNPVIVN